MARSADGCQDHRRLACRPAAATGAPHDRGSSPMFRSRTRVVTMLVLGALVALGAGERAASADSVAYGRVVMVDDGDTVDVDLAGDGTSKLARVRYIGVQAME